MEQLELTGRDASLCEQPHRPGPGQLAHSCSGSGHTFAAELTKRHPDINIRVCSSQPQGPCLISICAAMDVFKTSVAPQPKLVVKTSMARQWKLELSKTTVAPPLVVNKLSNKNKPRLELPGTLAEFARKMAHGPSCGALAV